MTRKIISERAIPILFDVVVWGGFAAFLFATYIACKSILDEFPGEVSKLLGILQSFMA